MDRISYGLRHNLFAIPRFTNINSQETDFLRGYGIWGGAHREGINPDRIGIGADFKTSLSTPGPWKAVLIAYGECLPYYDNKVELDHDHKDKWGLPLLKISVEFKDNEMVMRRDMKAQVGEIFEAAGIKDIDVWVEEKPIPGDSVHDMGGVRMGRDPKTSVLNGHNQCHDVPNLFVTDGSCMTSCSNMAPSLTFMALTARACDYAVKQMKKGEI